MATKKKVVKKKIKKETFAQFPSRQGRSWLVPNVKEGTDSYISWNVYAEEYRQAHGKKLVIRYGDANLKLADCNRIVSIGFNCSEEGLKKLRGLIYELTQFQYWFEEAMKFVNVKKEVVKDE